MPWNTAFSRRTPNTRICWGHQFEWTDDHLEPDKYKHLQHSYDVLADDCLDVLDEISPPPTTKSTPADSKNDARTELLHTASDDSKRVPPRDLYALLERHHGESEKLSELWTQLTTVPDWVDWEQIGRGQDVLFRYAGPILTGLAYQSLLGAMGGTRVVETLSRTGGFSVKVARRRLFETTQHILQCAQGGISALKPGGEGFVSSVRVRFLHAAVRKRIMKLAKARPAYFDIESLGVPINDLDSIGTITTFSSTLIWLALPWQGILLRDQEIRDYLAFWRFVAHLVGAPTDCFATPAKAKAMLESLLMSEIRPTKTGAILANNIIAALENQPPGYPSRELLCASARWLNGHALCDALELPRPPLYYYGLMAGQCIFFSVFCYSQRLFPNLDRRKIETIKRWMWIAVVESRHGLGGIATGFDFEHIPTDDNGEIKAIDAQEYKRGRRDFSADERALKWLVIGAVVFGIMTAAAIALLATLARWARGLF